VSPPIDAGPGARVAIVVKGYPRLSETFIAQEILGLEQRGVPLEIWSLRHPTEHAVHPMHKRIAARPAYLPEYLHREPLRVLKGLWFGLHHPGRRALLGQFWRDLRRDPTRNRVRRLGQACVLARELAPEVTHIHVHYLHTPASVARYAALLTGRTWTYSAHAKDIWTTPEWEKREKLADALWGVTCTAYGADHLRALAPAPERVTLAYHGLDLSRFPAPPQRPARDGSDPANPVRIVCVGRAVAKKGLGDLLKALAALPPDLHWRFAHVGSGALLSGLKAQAARDGIADRVAFLGAKAQPEIVALLREADVFALAATQAASGDRDGLPNVLLEAASQGLAIVATDFAGIPELITTGREGELVGASDWEALSNAINLLARDPLRRDRLGAAAYERLRRAFSADGTLDLVAARLRSILGREAAPQPVAQSAAQ
jgi:glycosyltransferase involved in cell wall biosynthesis